MTNADGSRGFWNERYRARGTMWGVEANRFVVEQLSGLSPRRVLDLGCGQGRNAIWLALEGHEVTAVDLSDIAIDQARRAAADAGVEVYFAARDLATWRPAAESYDLVVLSYLQVPEQLRTIVHASAAAALAPSGRVFLIAHHRENLEHGIGGPQSAEVLFTEEQLARDFAALDIVRNEKVLRPVEKDGVIGTALDVLLIAEKPAA